MKLRATQADRPVPREGMKPQYDKQGRPLHLIGAEPVEVPDTAYYRKRVRKGDLIPAEPAVNGKDK